MTHKQSFTKYENEILPGYRDRLNHAESTEDAKKFFIYAVMDLMHKIFGHSFQIYYEDVKFLPDQEPPYSFSQNIRNNPEFSSAMESSDLEDILHRLAQTAVKRYSHLDKHPERTEKKIYHP